MNVPMIVGYEVRLQRLVECFERDCARIRAIHARPRCHTKGGSHVVSWSRVYEAVASLDPEPANYRRVGDVLGADDSRTLWRVATNLRGLERRGFLRVVGRSLRYGRRTGAKLYRVADREPRLQSLLERRAARFVTEAARIESALRIAERISDAAASGLRIFGARMRERNARILAERARGVSLQRIADRFGLSRERVRQVVAQAIAAQQTQGPPRRDRQADRIRPPRPPGQAVQA